MIVTCPACSVRYVAEAAAFPSEGRVLRCSSCGHSWRQKPIAAPVAAATTAPTPVASPIVAPAMPSKIAHEPQPLPPIAPLDLHGDNDFNPTTPSPLLFGWVALLLLILLLGGAAYFMRDAVRERFPSTRVAYNIVFANDETKQLIDAPQVQRLDDKGVISLLLKGQIRNNDTVAATPLPLDVQVLGSNGVTLSTQQFNDYPLKSLLPKSSIPFEVRISNVAPDAAEIKLSVVKAAPVAPAPVLAPAAEAVALPAEKTPDAAPTTPEPAAPMPTPVELDVKSPTNLAPAAPTAPATTP